jgi:HK97 family phage major capsid protein
MLQHHIRTLRAAERQTAFEIESVIRKAENFDILELVRERTEDYFGPRNMPALHAMHDLDHACTKLAGAADGRWVPFSVLCRDLTTSSASAITGSKTQSSIAPALAPASVIVGVGANVLSVIKAGALRLPVFSQAADATGAWNAEGTVYIDAEPQFGQVVVEPKTIAVKVVFTRRLLMNATPDIEREVRRHLLESLMREVDRAAIAGSGINNEPLGLLNNPEVPVVVGGANGAAPTWDHVTQLEYEVASRNGRIENGAFVTTAEVLRKLRRTPRASGLGFIVEGDARLLGYPVRVSSHVPNNLTKGTGSNLSAILFGDWSDYLIVFWGPQAVDVIVDSASRAREGLVIVTARVDVGFAPIHPQSFAVMKDCITT